MKLDDSARGSHDTVTRLINRMLEAGVIDAAAHARLMAGGLPTNPHSMIGFLEALLAISLWRDE